MESTRALTIIDSAPIDRLQRIGTIATVAGFVIGGIGVAVDRTQFAPSWLIGFVFCTGLSLGSLALLMTQYMSGGNWGLVSRRIFEAGSRLLPYCAVLFIPVAAMLASLYPWARPEAATDRAIQAKALYLNWKFFIARTVIYFAVWILCATLLNSWSAGQD